jgi:very-short-patch-repair endonuclease
MSGLTAARLRGWWLPKSSMDGPIEITVPPPFDVRRPGVRCRRAWLMPADITLVNGLRLTSPMRTLLDLAATQPLIDLIVLADAALYFKHCTVEQLGAAGLIPGRRGAQRFRRMLALIDPESESPMESLLRLVVVLSGLPRPESQVNIWSDTGHFIARGDLKVPAVRAIFEYDGRDHDEPARHAGDVRRWRALREAGYEVYPYTASDLFRCPGQIVSDYQRAIGLPIDARSVRGWLKEWRLSGYR